MKKLITLFMLIPFFGISTIVKAQTDPDTVSIDRFSEDAGHLFIRDDENGLPGPNEPINFDMEPFFSRGLGPDGELIGYYNFDVMPTAPAPIYVLFREGETTPVEGQMNIIDVIPGDTTYNDFWQVEKVTVPSDYIANTVTSYQQIMDSAYMIQETTILVNCPVVPYGSTAKLRMGGGSPELTTGWYKGMVVFYFNFTEKSLMTDDMNMVPLSPIYVTFNINPGEEGGGPPSGFMTDPATGRTHNVTATLPDDDDYSPLWMVNIYDNADFWNVHDLASAMDATILVEGAANVNCPVVAQYMGIDRFSEAAGHLFVRNDNNGLPGPNEPIDFDMEPFFSKGLGPMGELIGYYNFDVMPTEPAPIYVLFRDGESHPVDGQMNIINVIPGDTAYNDFWQVHKVTVPSDYVANTVTSYDQIMEAGYPMEETTILVNCPVVPEGSTAGLRYGEGSPELTMGWYKSMIVYYFNFVEKALMTDDMGMVPLSPIYVTFNINPGDEGGGPPSGFMTDTVTGRTHNVAATLPEDDDYSPLWMVNIYDNADFWNVHDLASAMDATILVEGAANVNCPVVTQYVGIDRFSEAAGHLFVRNDENGLPGPNEPINFDMDPFISDGFGPMGEWISYYNFDVMPTQPAPIYVLFRDGESSPVDGQMNIVDVIPGDTTYNDFWQVYKVTVPSDYVANTVKSYDQIMEAGYPMEETSILVNCPVVPEGSTATLRYGDGSHDLTMGWYKGMIVYYFNFVEKALMTDDMGMVPLSPIYVTFNINPGEEGGGPPSGFMIDSITGRTHNVAATLPEDDDYSPLWKVNIYDNADFWDVYDLASAMNATILVEGAANVNCPVVKVDEATSIEENLNEISAIRLDQNFPNPFSNSTNIRFSIDQSERITLRVFNIRGKQVAELMNRRLEPGEYSIRWDAQNEAEGIYFYTIRAGRFQDTKKMTLLK